MSYIIISYDIRDDKRRNRLARLLKNYARRMQYSVFEGELNSRQVAALRQDIQSIIHPEQDSVRIYRLCRDCKQQTVLFGPGDLYEDPDVYIF